MSLTTNYSHAGRSRAGAVPQLLTAIRAGVRHAYDRWAEARSAKARQRARLHMLRRTRAEIEALPPELQRDLGWPRRLEADQ